jgi:hypothetical protein
MMPFIPPLAIAAVVTGVTEASTQMLEHQTVGIPTLASIACVVFCSGLWLEHRFTKLETRFDNLDCNRNKTCREIERQGHDRTNREP